ncbi:MAG: hypothetical protein EB120_00680 [Proteobacteria bacterium]|nr:hypothetical protein [Pseudomonadota bacterium]
MKHLLFLTGFFSVFGFSQSIRIPYDLSKVRSFRDWQGEFLVVPGQPKVPKITARILVPYGQTVKKVEFVFDSTQVLFEKRRLERVSFPLATCLDKSSQSRLPSPIENSAWYPQKPWSEPSIIQKYGYQVLYVDLYPAQYQSELEVISWLPSGDLQIEFTDSRAFFLENLRSDEQDEREALLLADDISAQSTYPPVSAKGGLAEYLIIGPKEFLADQSEYSINGLMREKASRGITSKYLTLEDIGTQFAGSSTQEKIRAAVKKSYKEEGTRYLLLIGNGYSKTPTKILTVELSEGSLPSDLYFGCLDGDFKTRPYDLACEVAVGRAPASTVAELRAFWGTVKILTV